MDKRNDLIIPIYLNQKIVFDMLAILEDGFSTIRNIQRKDSQKDESAGNIGGEIGTSNIFALLGVKLKTNWKEEKKNETDQVISEERIHTPVSLFSKLLEKLYEKKLIKEIKCVKNLDEVKTGDFVLFNGRLSKNPLISIFESMG